MWADDLDAACQRYEQLLAELGGVDVQLLGIGSDGHIGFNEPGSSSASRTRIKTLTAATAADNARFFASLDEVPRHVVTQGLATIGAARHVVLVACWCGEGGAGRASRRGPAGCDVARRRCCSCTLTRRSSSTRLRRPSWSWPTTTARRTPASRRGSTCDAAARRHVRPGERGSRDDAPAAGQPGPDPSAASPGVDVGRPADATRPTAHEARRRHLRVARAGTCRRVRAAARARSGSSIRWPAATAQPTPTMVRPAPTSCSPTARRER